MYFDYTIIELDLKSYIFLMQLTGILDNSLKSATTHTLKKP